MIALRKTGRFGWVRLGILLLCLSTAVGESRAEDFRLQAQLIWGTNDEHSPNPDFKAVDARLRKKLQMFKWQNYFEVNRHEIVAPAKKAKRIQMSTKCVVEVTNLGDSTVEMKLIGEGKQVTRQRHKFAPGESFVLASDDKNDTAWFVVFSLPKR